MLSRMQTQELDWLRQDISLLSVQVDRRHAFLTNVRDRARAHADLCEDVERRASQMREGLQEHRRREQQVHQEILDATRTRPPLADWRGFAQSLDEAADDDSGGMFARLMRTRREAWRVPPPSLHAEPFPLATFEAQAQLLKADLKEDEVCVIQNR